MTAHKDLSPENMHPIHSYAVADEAERLALTVGATDIGKIAKQGVAGATSLYLLASIGPDVWIEVGAGSTDLSGLIAQDIIHSSAITALELKTDPLIAEPLNSIHTANLALAQNTVFHIDGAGQFQFLNMSGLAAALITEGTISAGGAEEGGGGGGDITPTVYYMHINAAEGAPGNVIASITIPLDGTDGFSTQHFTVEGVLSGASDLGANFHSYEMGGYGIVNYVDDAVQDVFFTITPRDNPGSAMDTNDNLAFDIYTNYDDTITIDLYGDKLIAEGSRFWSGYLKFTRQHLVAA